LAATIAGLAFTLPAFAQITLYQDDGFQGRSFTTRSPVRDFSRQGFNDRASSAVVTGQQWEICDNSNFGGSCRVLRPGQYPSLTAMGLNDRVSSVRAVARNVRVPEERYSPAPVVSQDYRRRGQERLYQANVTSTRAVYGAPEQRCWVERNDVQEPSTDPRVPGAILGAVLGGILGHQIGGGTGRDVATVGGVVAGAVVGGKISGNRDSATNSGRDVQRCSGNPGQQRPAYWDVSYEYRGKTHSMQMTTPPGSTVTVNRDGEPRV
jgi:uncharacterized protein YcfJ